MYSSDFDSSEDEGVTIVAKNENNWGLPDRFPNAGARSIEMLLATSEEDRIRAEEYIKNLSYCLSCPQSQCNMWVWVQRFQTFRMSTLKCSPEATPTVEQLEQFIPVILQAMKPASGNKVVSVGTVLGSLGFIKDGWAVFQYEDFKLDKHDDKRLAAFLETLVLENKLTGSHVKERKRKFVGTNVIQLMVQRLLRDALSNGTPSWDIVIMKATELVLHSACEAQMGNYQRSDKCEGNQHLQWKDIAICLDTRDNHEVLIATITLNSNDRNMEVTIAELLEPCLNTLCVVKLLLIHALRTGAVAQTSWAELKNNITNTKGKTLEWLQPDRSVICKSSDGNGIPYYMNLDKPATSFQANNQPPKVANDAGHDIHRGPARQIACNSRTKLDPSDGTRRPLGHSFGALYSGTTARYVGAPDDDTGDGGTEGHIESPGHDTWRPGVLTGLPVNGKHHIDFVSPPQPKKRVKLDKVAQECERQNLDPDVTKNRLRTFRALREVCTDEWRADARDELAKPPEPEARLIARMDAQPPLDDGISTGDGDANDLSELDIADLSSGHLLLDESDKIISSLGAGNIETLPDVLSNQIWNTKSL
ncbi:hypothetical protein F5Y08DRAFT_355364 [Xylaria arbuscula]|nr:hypothetical protein F5Y08DRAFT_355364 [Xylaria arbuscula]